MFKPLFTIVLIQVFACGILSAQELSPIHQPLTPQDSGTTNGLISVLPVNPQVVWACSRNGTFTVTTQGGRNAWIATGERGHCRGLGYD